MIPMTFTSSKLSLSTTIALALFVKSEIPDWNLGARGVTLNFWLIMSIKVLPGLFEFIYLLYLIYLLNYFFTLLRFDLPGYKKH